jgi:hypothetical protein
MPAGSDKAKAVQGEVRSLLSRSQAFLGLPAEAQERLAADMEKVSSYLADKGWLLPPPPTRATALEDKKQPDAVDQLKLRLAQGPEQVGKSFTAGAIREGTAAFTELVQKVDFAKFVGGLIHNVFQAVVDASIQQMQAYGELLSATAKTVDQFAGDHINDAQARDYVANRYPGAVEVDTSGDGPSRLRAKQGGTDIDVGQQFGLDSVDFEDAESEQKLVDAAKLEMARSRQQLLATMVLLGINRIVVTNGHINAKVLFDMKATDTASARNKAQMNDEQKMHAQSSTGLLTNLVGGYDVGASHETTVASAVDERSDSRATLKAQLSGDVRLAFKSETFPLERMVDVLGMQDLNKKATPAQWKSPAPPKPAAPAPAPAPAGGGK